MLVLKVKWRSAFLFYFANLKQKKCQITSSPGCSALFFVCLFLLTRDLVLHVCAPVIVFVFPGHEHDWFRVRIGHDEVLVVRVLGFSLGVVHMWMWCLGLAVCCSPYPAVCTMQCSPFAAEVCIVWVCPPSPQLDHPPDSSRATLPKSSCVVR